MTNDSGSTLGIIISKSGFQSGAYEAAYCSNVLLKDWNGFVQLIERQWIIKQTVRIKKIAQPLSVYTDPLDVPFEYISENKKLDYKEITNNCLDTYIACMSMNKDMFSQEQIIVNHITFTALDELFDYFESVFTNAIKQYEKVFEHSQVEKWKFECYDYMLVSNIQDFID